MASRPKPTSTASTTASVEDLSISNRPFVTYKAPNGFSITGGKFLSCSGWETAEPTGLYQYSYSATLVYGGYQNGAAAGFGNGKIGFFGSVVSSVWDGSDTSFDDLGFETQISLTPSEAITAKVAYALGRQGRL